MLTYTRAKSERDLEGILQLQQANLAIHLTTEELSAQGFVTVVHSLNDLRKMNNMEQHIIAKDGETVVAYVLAMTPQSKNDIAILQPMFETFDSIQFRGRPVSHYNYMVVGQVCVAKPYRGQGVLDHCYTAYKEAFVSKYDFAITEIDAANLRSLQAHKRIGFKTIHTYQAPDHVHWEIVVWGWN